MGLLHLAEFRGVCGKRRSVEHFSLADNVRFGLGLGVKTLDRRGTERGARE
jgi:hypothetical protein